MPGRFILDTNLAYLLATQDQAVQARATAANALFIPSIVIGELYYGAYRIEQTRKGKALVSLYNALVATYAVLTCDAVTGEICGRLRADLDAAGKRIPLHDAWIAALAKQHALAIATRDAHFDVVPGITVERW